MAWLYLFVAGLAEVAWAVLMKASHGFSRLWPTVGFVVAMAVSLLFLGKAVKTLPLGTAYAIWTGIGTIGTIVMGILFLGEPKDPVRILCLALILAGIVGLKLNEVS